MTTDASPLHPLCRTLLPIWLLLLGALSGCYTHATMHRAEPVPQGDSEITLGGGLLGGINGGRSGTDGTDNVPSLLLQTRFGLGEDLGLGFRLNGIGLEADLNWAYVNRDDLALSLNPEVSVAFNKPSPLARDGNLGTPLISNHVLTSVNLLADVIKKRDFDLTVALKPGFMFRLGQNFVGRTGPVLGAGVGMRIDMPDGSFNGVDALITPSIDVLLPLHPETLGYGQLGYSAMVGFAVKL